MGGGLKRCEGGAAPTARSSSRGEVHVLPLPCTHVEPLRALRRLLWRLEHVSLHAELEDRHDLALRSTGLGSVASALVLNVSFSDTFVRNATSSCSDRLRMRCPCRFSRRKARTSFSASVARCSTSRSTESEVHNYLGNIRHFLTLYRA